MWSVPRIAPPPEFEGSRDPTPKDIKSLPSISQQAVHALESCIAEHHLAEIDYRDAEGRQKLIRLRPGYIHHNTAHHIVVWGFPDDADHWIQLRLDGIAGVRDTGDVFEPAW
jgi:hypothetical protein